MKKRKLVRLLKKYPYIKHKFPHKDYHDYADRGSYYKAYIFFLCLGVLCAFPLLLVLTLNLDRILSWRIVYIVIFGFLLLLSLGIVFSGILFYNKYWKFEKEKWALNNEILTFSFIYLFIVCDNPTEEDTDPIVLYFYDGIQYTGRKIFGEKIEYLDEEVVFCGELDESKITERRISKYDLYHELGEKFNLFPKERQEVAV